MDIIEQNKIGKLVGSAGRGRRKFIWMVQDGLIEKVDV